MARAAWAERSAWASSERSPLVSTSANLSGQPAAVSAGEVASMFGSGVDMIIEGGTVTGGKGSSIVDYDPETQKLLLIRDGSIPFEKISERFSL